MDYTATANITTSMDMEDIMDTLETYAPSLSESKEGYRIIYTYPANTIEQALDTAYAIAKTVGTPYAVATAPTDLINADTESGAMPPLLSATQAAEMLGITPQAIKKRIKAGTLSGTKVGNMWVVPMASALSQVVI